MGKFSRGILGGFSGKVGNVVGVNNGGSYYMRSLPSKSKKPPTEAQLRQRLKFSLVLAFLRPIRTLISVGYQSFKKKGGAFGAATGYLLENAITGVYPALSIDYTKVKVSRGSLLGVANPELVTTAGTSEIEFNWSNNALAGTINGTDMATLLVYSDVLDEYIMLAGAAPRSAETFSLAIPPRLLGQEVYCWMTFVRADGKQASDSRYMGKVPVI